MRIKRILVGLDPSSRNQAMLENVTDIASILSAKVLGIFVEDVNLLRMAHFPFTCEVRYPSAIRCEVDQRSMQKSLRSLAKQTKKEFESIAKKKGVDSTFQVKRGNLFSELWDHAKENDLVVFNKSKQPKSIKRRLGSHALSLLKEKSEIVSSSIANLAVIPAIQALSFSILLHKNGKNSCRKFHNSSTSIN